MKVIICKFKNHDWQRSNLVGPWEKRCSRCGRVKNLLSGKIYRLKKLNR